MFLFFPLSLYSYVKSWNKWAWVKIVPFISVLLCFVTLYCFVLHFLALCWFYLGRFDWVSLGSLWLGQSWVALTGSVLVHSDWVSLGLLWLGQSWFTLTGSVLVRFDWFSLGSLWLGQSWFTLTGSVLVRFDWLRLGSCLLYTSPSPRDSGISRMPSSAWK